MEQSCRNKEDYTMKPGGFINMLKSSRADDQTLRNETNEGCFSAGPEVGSRDGSHRRTKVSKMTHSHNEKCFHELIVPDIEGRSHEACAAAQLIHAVKSSMGRFTGNHGTMPKALLQAKVTVSQFVTPLNWQVASCMDWTQPWQQSWASLDLSLNLVLANEVPNRMNK
jgi:hypothetical protein